MLHGHGVDITLLRCSRNDNAILTFQRNNTLLYGGGATTNVWALDCFDHYVYFRTIKVDLCTHLICHCMLCYKTPEMDREETEVVLICQICDELW